MARSSSPTCGPFVLERRLARGGMGDVWGAWLGATPIAVKFLASADPFARSLFAREARAHARLQHPSILRILDIGQLEADVPDGPAAGSPWIALEYVSGGDLVRLMPRLRWEGVRVVLHTLLDALSYAHAQGVVHRDLKPKNVLLSGTKDPEPGLRLADFGIARFGAHAEAERAILGSPSTIAPEQCRGAIREVGPWTDLYALGCMGFRMVAGSWPFSGRGVDALRAHLELAPPELRPSFPVPDGVAGWLGRLLAKSIRERFHSCAEAADALAALPEVVDPDERLPAALVVARARLPARRSRSYRSTSVAPPVVVGAGRGLAPLRTWRTQGRDVEREALWERLEEVRSSRRCAVVLLRGARGVGRSHLGDWLARAASHRGVGLGLRTPCFPDDRPGDALRRLLGTMLATEGLTGPELVSAVRTHLGLWGEPDEDLVQALVVALGAEGSSRIRRGALRRLLVDRAAAGAAVVWFDDAGAHRDVIRFVATTLQNDLRAPLLFVLDTGEAVGEDLDALAELPRVETLVLGKLTDRDIARLVDQSLPVASGLKARIVEEAEGSPGRCREIVERLAIDARLRTSRFGFALRRRDALPTSSSGEERRPAVERLMTEIDPASFRRLARAAVLGDFVPHGMWARVCGDPLATQEGLPLGPVVARFRLLSRLQELGLASDQDAGWRWESASARSAVLARAAESEELIAAHRAVAELVAEEPPTSDVLARLARHLRDAGLLVQALDVYERWIVDAPDERTRFAMCDEVLATATRVSLSRGDPRLGRFRAYRLHAMPLGNPGEVSSGAEALLADATAHGWDDVAALASVIATLTRWMAEGTIIDGANLPSIPWSDTPATPVLLHAWLYVAESYRMAEKREAGREVVDRVLRAARGRGWRDLQGRAEVIGAKIDCLELTTDPAGIWDLASDLLRHGYFARARDLRSAAALLAFRRGELDRARRYFLQTHGLDRLSSNEYSFPLLMLTQIALTEGDTPSARLHLDEVRAAPELVFYRCWRRCLEVGLSALEGDAAVAEVQLDLLAPLMEGRGVLTEEAVVLEQAAARFDALGHTTLAARIRVLAAD
ncbi:MAG: protein kinase [Alphaproteobacteria bacterium]|nr:protein kinase [Alphaproteobacteria bacterium]